MQNESKTPLHWLEIKNAQVAAVTSNAAVRIMVLHVCLVSACCTSVTAAVFAPRFDAITLTFRGVRWKFLPPSLSFRKRS